MCDFKRVKCILAVLFYLGFTGCGQDLPFEYKYKSKTEVDIIYKGTTYELRQGSTVVDTPFEYQFEADGDLDIIVEGRQYEIDSPYDVDIPKVVKKKTVKKKSSKKTSRRR